MKSDSGNSRREFLKLSGLGLFGAAALGTITLRTIPADAQAPKKLVLVSESEPMAKTLGYVAVAEKADIKKFPKRATPEGKTQFCHNCILLNGGKVTTDKEAPCALFTGKAVAAGGWCNSWAKNPAAK